MSNKYILPMCIADGFTTVPPVRGTSKSAGYDVYIPELTPAFIALFEEKNSGNLSRKSHIGKRFDPKLLNSSRNEMQIRIPPFGSVIIPTGLHFNIPEDTFLEVANRSGIAAKEGLVCGAHIIDEDYQGQVLINLINTTDLNKELEFGTRVAQLLHKDVILSSIQLKDPKDLYSKVSERGEGALGSTGKN